MPILGVDIAILRAGKVLLTQRQDFHMWCLPGGHVNEGESIAQAARREAREETGLEVRLRRLVGIYSVPAHPGGGGHSVVFAAEPVGGVLQPDPAEVRAAGYFVPEALPEPLLWWHRRRVLDAMRGTNGSLAWVQHVEWPFTPDLTRQALYALHEQSGLSGEAFFRQHFQTTTPEAGEILELGDPPLPRAAFDMRPLTPADRAWVTRLAVERWGATLVVAHGTAYQLHDLPGFVAFANDDPAAPAGLLTYHIAGTACEIVSIDSLKPNTGVGTALIGAAVAAARQAGCTRLWLITTNDNVNALRFYQKRGFVLVAVHPNAVEASRRVKPDIPLIGDDGIPIRDEIELEMQLAAQPG